MSAARVGVLRGLIVHDICDDWAISSGTSTDILKLFGEPLQGVVVTGLYWLCVAGLRGVAGSEFAAEKPTFFSF